MRGHSPRMVWLDPRDALPHEKGTGENRREPAVIRGFRQDGLRVWRGRVPGLALVALLLGGSAGARDLTVGLNDAAAPVALGEAVVRPFAAAEGVAVDIQGWEGGVAALKPKVEAGAWDVVSLGGADLLAGCEAGLREKLDWSALGGRERLLAGGASECGRGVALRATILTWDKEKVQGTPGWAEFGDVVKMPGRRGLRKNARGTLEIALMADGVAPGEVYRTLRTEAGVDRAFRKLEQLRPYIIWWQDEVEAARLLTTGDVLMTSAPAGAVAEANRQEGRNFAMQWQGALTTVVALSVAKGSTNLPLAMKLLAYAAEAKVQARLAGMAPLGPLAKGALEGMAAEAVAMLPTGPVALAAGVPVDEAFWRDNMAKLSQRFDVWLPR